MCAQEGGVGYTDAVPQNLQTSAQSEAGSHTLHTTDEAARSALATPRHNARQSPNSRGNWSEGDGVQIWRPAPTALNLRRDGDAEMQGSCGGRVRKPVEGCREVTRVGAGLTSKKKKKKKQVPASDLRRAPGDE